MKTSPLKLLIPAVLLVLAAAATLPAARADDTSKQMIGSVSDNGASALDPGSNGARSADAKPAGAKQAKKRKKKKHKKASHAQPSGSQDSGAAAGSASPADSGK